MSVWDTSEFYTGDFVEESPALFNGVEYKCIRYAEDLGAKRTEDGRRETALLSLSFRIADFTKELPVEGDKITFNGKDYEVDSVDHDSAGQDIIVDLSEWVG